MEDNPTLKKIREMFRDGNIETAEIETLSQLLTEVHNVRRTEDWVNERKEQIDWLERRIDLYQSKTLVRLSWGLLWLTVALLVVTVALLVVEMAHFHK